MNKTALKILSALLMSAIIASSLISCDLIFSSVKNPETLPAESESKTAVEGSESEAEDISDSEAEEVSESKDADISESEGASQTESAQTENESTLEAEVTTTESDLKSESATTEATTTKAPEESESKEATTTAPQDVRFDYFGADMSEYISLDEALYKGFSANLPDYLDGSDDAVMKYIEFLCSQYPVSTGNKIVDRPIENGDTVALYYEGWLNGEKFAGGSNMDDAKPYMLTIGSGAFIPGFEDSLIGVVPNETSRENLHNLYVTFPENYHSADLAGKAVIFKVYVEYIDEFAPAEYTEDFITKTLGYSTSATDVKADFEKYLKEEYLPDMRYDEIGGLTWENITGNAVILQYPQSEIGYFYNSYIDQYEYYKQYYEYFGYKFNSLGDFVIAYLGLAADADWQAVIMEQCELDVMQNLAFHAIAQKEGISVTDEAYADAIQYYVDYYTSQGYSVTPEMIVQEIGDRMLREQALWTLVNDFIVANFIPATN